MCDFPHPGPATRPPHPFPPAFFSPLAAVRDSRRLLHPYREALSSVDFWEASGTGLSARQLEIGLERRRITGKLSSALLQPAKAPFFAWPPLSTPRADFSFRFRSNHAPPHTSPSTTRTRTKGRRFHFPLFFFFFFFFFFTVKSFSRTDDGSKYIRNTLIREFGE